jgi:beta-glucosidase
MLLLCIHATAQTAALYKDATQTVDIRVSDLLSRMTLEEKCDQLRQMELARLQIFDGAVSPESLERFTKDRTPGIVLMEAGADAAENTIKARDLQAHLLQKSRLGIPPLFITGGAHGVLARGATIFPGTLALGATWSPALVRDMASQLAVEAAAIGAAQLLGPSFALGRDPRFGGIEQCFGECPTLVTEMALAYMEGLQGRRISDGLAPNKVFGTALHFAGWGSADGGLYGAPVSLSTRTLRSLHFPPFYDAVQRAKIQAVVPVVSTINSIPGHANFWLLDNVLRQEWRFPGIVLAAPGGVAMNYKVFAIAGDNQAAAVQALTAGVDVETGGDTYAALAALVRQGQVPTAAIDTAAGRVLRLKFLAGLFEERRMADTSLLPARLRTPEARALARRLATESIILLKNTDDFLPLDTNRIKTLAVIGPNADRSQFGGISWSRDDSDGVTVLRGLRNLLGTKVRLHYARGSGIVRASRDSLEEAVAVAKGADAALVVLGDESAPPVGGPRADGLPHSPSSGAGYDVPNPVLPDAQEELVRAIVATGRPVIVVFLQGRPCSAPWIKENATAILSMFYAGEEQGNALADVLFGKHDPGGRLPVSVARSAGHLPTTYDYKPGARGLFNKPGSPEHPGRDYVFSGTDPLWPFGFGLSYTRFQYSDLVVETPTVPSDGVIRVRFTVSNIGEREGTDVAQIYFHDPSSAVTVPAMRLVRFEKIQLKAGQKTQVVLAFEATALAEWDRSIQRRVVEPGEFEILVGSNAENILLRGTVRAW